MKRKKIKNKKEAGNKKKTRLFQNFGIGEEKDHFIENLTMLLASGMSILSALDAIKKEVRSKSMKLIIDEMKEGIDSGLSLSKVLKKTQLLLALCLFFFDQLSESTQNIQKTLEQEKKDI